MLLSALSLAAVLQVTPPVTLRGYRAPRRSIDATQSVDTLTLPLPKWAKAAKAPRVPVRRFTKAPPAAFVRDPMMANCHTARQLVGHPETLQVQPLAKMPKAHGERAVARLVDGCPVAVLIAQR